MSFSLIALLLIRILVGGLVPSLSLHQGLSVRKFLLSSVLSDYKPMVILDSDDVDVHRSKFKLQRSWVNI